MNLFGFGPAAIAMAIIMVLALIGMIICAKKQEMVPAAKPAAIACMGVIVACAGGILIKTGMFGDGGNTKLIANEMVYVKSAPYILGKYVGTKYPNSKILLFVDEGKNNIRQDEMISELKRGLGASCEIVGTECPKPIVLPPDGEELPATDATSNPAFPSMEMMVPIQELMTAESASEAISKYSGITMLITLVGFPRNFKDMDMWYEEDETKRLKVAVVNGEIYQLGPGIHSGQIVAAATYNPQAKFDESKAPSDPQAAFDKRYILVTPENVEETAQKYPGLFEIQK